MVVVVYTTGSPRLPLQTAHFQEMTAANLTAAQYITTAPFPLLLQTPYSGGMCRILYTLCQSLS